MIDYNHILNREQNLDPQDWNKTRALAHQMVDDVMDFLQNIRDTPSWQPIPDETKKGYKEDLPNNSSNITEIYEDFKQNIMPFHKGNVHPRFFAWVQGTGTPMGVMADMLASAMNSNVAIGEHSAMYIDQQVINWCKTMMGFPDGASGILVSGGSIANITGLIVARNHKAQSNMRQHGIKAQEKQMTIYCSTETHSCVIKGGETIGIGNEYIRKIRINVDFTVDIAAMENAIQQDIDNGFHPFCIIANVGTVNTGATDDLIAIRALCDKYDLWMHIDGAFGALAKLTPEYEESLKMIEEADSVAFDLHKWMYMPYEVGCILINDRAIHRAAFNLSPSYLLTHDRGLAAGPDPNNNYGMELSRGFKALKVWMSIKEHGIDKYKALIRQNIAQAFYLGHLAETHPSLELVTPVMMNITNYRYYKEGLSNEELNELNKNILMTIQERGIASPSSTLLHGIYCIRCAIVNHRSTKSDFDALIKATVEIGDELLNQY
jgi:aromatic-L-amino-acid/L-tryptophan decarboxylase